MILTDWLPTFNHIKMTVEEQLPTSVSFQIDPGL